MIFQEPKVEFITIQLADMLTSSGSEAVIGSCDGARNDDDCPDGTGPFNLPIDNDEEVPSSPDSIPGGLI